MSFTDYVTIAWSAEHILKSLILDLILDNV